MGSKKKVKYLSPTQFSRFHTIFPGFSLNTTKLKGFYRFSNFTLLSFFKAFQVEWEQCRLQVLQTLCLDLQQQKSTILLRIQVKEYVLARSKNGTSFWIFNPFVGCSAVRIQWPPLLTCCATVRQSTFVITSHCHCKTE